MFYQKGDERPEAIPSYPVLIDLITGEEIEVICPGGFILEAVLVQSAYYRSTGREYRFRLPDARCAGLNVGNNK